VAVGSGLPGLALGIGVAGLLALAMVKGLRGRRPGPPGAAARAAGTAGTADTAGIDVATLGAAATVLALLVFLMVSPSDPAALVPCLALAGLAAGPPNERLRSRPRVDDSAVRRAVWLGLLGLSAAALLATGYLGVQLYRADSEALRAANSSDRVAGARAVRLMPSVPVYGLIAWSATVRQALASGRDTTLLRSGETYLRSSLAADPTAASTRIAQVRYYLMFHDIDQAMAEIRRGLRDNPSSPLLQGLWGYVAQALAASQATRPQATTLTRRLQALPPTSADGLYWLGVALQAIGSDAAGRQAVAEAQRLAPGLTAANYLQRLQGSY